MGRFFLVVVVVVYSRCFRLGCLLVFLGVGVIGVGVVGFGVFCLGLGGSGFDILFYVDVFVFNFCVFVGV